jgi:hypothetical protein
MISTAGAELPAVLTKFLTPCILNQYFHLMRQPTALAEHAIACWNEVTPVASVVSALSWYCN